MAVRLSEKPVETARKLLDPVDPFKGGYVDYLKMARLVKADLSQFSLECHETQRAAQAKQFLAARQRARAAGLPEGQP